jgi:hypothetical protein
MNNLIEQSLDWKRVKDVEHFFFKINERLLHKMGALSSYDDGGEAALGQDVEYFHFSICGDDRMRYLGQNVVLEDSLNDRNKACNAVISHLYGGRRIHSLLTGITDPKKAHLDFERINVDPDYVQWMRENAEYAKLHGHKFYGTTELHTSLQTAARNFCRVKYNDSTRAASNTDIVEWIAGFISKGLIDKILGAKNLQETFNLITSEQGIGAYYGYHLGIDCSLIPGTAYHHDEKFCVPGPGACHTMDLMFPTLHQKVKKMPYGDLVVWIEQNQKRLYPRISFNPVLWNIENAANGKKMFSFNQDKFMVYGCEVAHCQYGIYDRLKNNPHLIEKRRCGVDPDLSALVSREQGNPLPAPSKGKVTTHVNTSLNCLLEF